MSEVMFVVKSLLLSVVVTMLMQIQVGDSNLETKAELWIRTSSVSKFLQGVATGAIKASKSATQSISQMINKGSREPADHESTRASR